MARRADVQERGHAVVMKLTRALVGCSIVIALAGCATTPESDITPLPRAGKLALDRAVALTDPPMESLAQAWSSAPGSEEFAPIAEGKTESVDNVCVYRSTVYQAKGDTSQEQWIRLAELAEPVMEDLGLDTSAWVDEHAAVGGGLVARGTSGAVFIAQPRATDDAEPNTFDAVRLFMRVPVHDAEC